MPGVSLIDLIVFLGDSRLLEPAQLDEVTDQLVRKFFEPALLLEELVRRGWLTSFQSERLAQGRGRDLLLGPYVLQKRLGEGSLGPVFRARVGKQRHHAILKIFNPEVVAQPHECLRLGRLARTAALLTHPNLARFENAFQTGSTYFWAMEHIDGFDLGELIDARGPLPILEACSYLRQATLGAQVLHQQGIIHRNLRPSKFLVAVRDSTIKLVDLSLALPPGIDLPPTSALIGTPGYVAPEQVKSAQRVDARADLYSLGCTFFFLLTGRPPFGGTSVEETIASQLLSQSPAVEQVRPDVPVELAQALRRLLAKRPEDRFASAAELLEVFDGLLSPRPGTITPSPVISFAEGTSSLKPADRSAPEPAGAGDRSRTSEGDKPTPRRAGVEPLKTEVSIYQEPFPENVEPVKSGQANKQPSAPQHKLPGPAGASGMSAPAADVAPNRSVPPAGDSGLQGVVPGLPAQPSRPLVAEKPLSRAAPVPLPPNPSASDTRGGAPQLAAAAGMPPALAATPASEAVGLLEANSPRAAPRRQNREADSDLVPPACVPAEGQNSGTGMVRSLWSRVSGGLGRVKEDDPVRNPSATASRTTPTPPTAWRMVEAACPATPRAGEYFTLRLQLHPLPEAPGRPAAQPSETGPLRIALTLSAENLRVEGESRLECLVPGDLISQPAMFQLQALAPAPARICIDVAQNGRPVGSLNLNCQVEPPEMGESEGEVKSSCLVALALTPTAAPDAVLTVYQRQCTDQPGQLRFVLSSTHPALRDLPTAGADLGVQDLRGDVPEWVGRQLGVLAALAEQGAGPDVVHKALAEVGCNLFDQLLPRPLQDLYWTLRERDVQTLLILSDETHIPWELVKPYKSDTMTGIMQKEDPFWGETFALTAWTRGRPPVSHLSLDRVFAAATLGMDAANSAELDVVRSLLKTGSQVLTLPSRRNILKEALEKGDFDLLHIVRHVASPAEAAVLTLEDGSIASSDLPARSNSVLQRGNPLLFLSASHRGRPDFTLTDLGAWSACLLPLGCSGLVGPLWPATEAATVAFVQAFYDRLLNGLPLGRALRQARLHVRDLYPNDPSWLAFRCFGDPLATVDRGLGS